MEGYQAKGLKDDKKRGGYQIITRNSKYDSSPICRYWEEGAEAADIDNCIGSTEAKGKKSQCESSGFWTWETVMREKLCWVGGTG